MQTTIRAAAIILLLVAAIPTFSGENKRMSKIAATPPMGWNSYDAFGGRVTEEHVKANADYVAKYMNKCGWEYVVIDIAWYAEYSAPMPAYDIASLNIDEYGRVIPSPTLFPSSTNGRGFKPLADYIHAKGLKFGIHIMRGIPRVAVKQNTPVLGSKAKAADIANTKGICWWWEHTYGVDATKDGAQAYYDSIIKLYADWGVDFIKADDTSRPYHKGEIDMINAAIRKCSRPIVLSLSPGPTKLASADQVTEDANMWRLSADLWDRWGDIYKSFDYAEQWNPHRSPGHWPDLDMLPLGKLEVLPAEDGPERWSRLTHDEQITTMTLWVIFRSPLMVGGDMPQNDEWTKSLLTNAEVLDITQRSLNNRQLYRTKTRAAWVADGPKGVHYLALFNMGIRATTPLVALSQMGLTGRFAVRDLWARQDLGEVGSAVSSRVPSHGARLLKLTPVLP